MLYNIINNRAYIFYNLNYISRQVKFKMVTIVRKTKYNMMVYNIILIVI